MTERGEQSAEKDAKRERRPHYMCNHRTTICRDCDGSPASTSPWVTLRLPPVSPSPEEDR